MEDARCVMSNNNVLKKSEHTLLAHSLHDGDTVVCTMASTYKSYVYGIFFYQTLTLPSHVLGSHSSDLYQIIVKMESFHPPNLTISFSNVVPWTKLYLIFVVAWGWYQEILPHQPIFIHPCCTGMHKLWSTNTHNHGKHCNQHCCALLWVPSIGCDLA